MAGADAIPGSHPHDTVSFDTSSVGHYGLCNGSLNRPFCVPFLSSRKSLSSQCCRAVIREANLTTSINKNYSLTLLEVIKKPEILGVTKLHSLVNSHARFYLVPPTFGCLLIPWHSLSFKDFCLLYHMTFSLCVFYISVSLFHECTGYITLGDYLITWLQYNFILVHYIWNIP